MAQWRPVPPAPPGFVMPAPIFLFVVVAVVLLWPYLSGKIPSSNAA